MLETASDIENLNIMVQQQALDRAHMLVLKTAIEAMHEAQEAQRLSMEDQQKAMDEQAAVNLRLFKEHAELRGECTQHAIRLDTKSNQILASIKGQDMCDLVEGVTGDLIDAKLESITTDLEKMKNIIDIHEKREVGMATYLGNFAGERPAEGAAIMQSFEVVNQ